MIEDVRFERVSKCYRVPGAPGAPDGTSTASLSSWRRLDEFWAVREIDFGVLRGEAFGIIGRNGAGKSTLLKLLSGITTPTTGEITIRGRLAAMIEVGSGFHPELTGRDNVYLSGAILGLRRREISARMESIAEFSGVGPFLDVPVKFYSSGMYVRLGFAVAAHLEPDVLVVDEVLAVGDAEFQARCFRRFQDLKRRGVTMLIVSHDIGAIEQLCDRVLLVDHGRAIALGSPSEVITRYQQLIGTEVPDDSDDNQPSQAALTVEHLSLLSMDRQPILTASAGDPLIAQVALGATADHDAVDVRLSIYDFHRGQLITECTTRRPEGGVRVGRGTTMVEFEIPEVLLAPGVYTLGVTARPASAERPTGWRFGRTTLYVTGDHERGGVFLLPYKHRTISAEHAPIDVDVSEPRRERTGTIEPAAPMVSVIIPCYQQAHFLGDAIDSVVTQDYSNVEVIVVNDGSHDATAAVAARYPAVRYVYQENAGLAAARNRGLSLVSGEYVVFLDADDRLLPGALRAQVRHLAANRSAGFVVGRSYYITKEGTPLPTTQQPHPSGDAYAALLQRNRIRTPAMVMFRRLALERSGPFDSRVDACADYDMYLRVARLYPVEFHDGVVAEYRRHDQNMSLNDALMLSQLCGVIRRQWRHARGNHRLRAAWHEGRRSMREYYGDRLANRIRDRIRRRAGLAGTLKDAAILSIYHPMGLVGHLFRKTVNSAKKNREPDSSDRGSVALPS